MQTRTKQPLKVKCYISHLLECSTYLNLCFPSKFVVSQPEGYYDVCAAVDVILFQMDACRPQTKLHLDGCTLRQGGEKSCQDAIAGDRLNTAVRLLVPRYGSNADIVAALSIKIHLKMMPKVVAHKKHTSESGKLLCNVALKVQSVVFSGIQW